MPFLGKLKFEDDGGFPFTLLEPITYVTAIIRDRPRITVEAGFKTDLASIPRVLWNVLPPIGKYDEAAVVHDWLYRYDGCTRKQADDVLLEAMDALGVGRAARWAIYAGVRAGGWKPWGDYRAKEKTDVG